LIEVLMGQGSGRAAEFTRFGQDRLYVFPGEVLEFIRET